MLQQSLLQLLLQKEKKQIFSSKINLNCHTINEGEESAVVK